MRRCPPGINDLLVLGGIRADGRHLLLYYNPNKGENYHSQPTCSLVKDKYEPMTAFRYGELDQKPYSKLSPCPGCAPMPRREKIDELNAKSRKH